MSKVIIACVLGVVVLSVGVTTQRGRTPDSELQAAIRTETIDGDLETAIEQFKQIAARYAGNRPLVAQALVRMAGCYDKLGAAEARKIYEQVVREYPDQVSQVAVARAHLARSDRGASSREPLLRRIWQGNRSATPLSDGRFISYDADQNLVLRDSASGRERVLTHKKVDSNDHSAGWLASKDGTQLVYTWYTDQKNRYELRLASLQGTGVPSFRVLFDAEDQNVTYPEDWSPDGKWIAVRIQRKDRTSQMGLVSVSDGSLRPLKSSGWNSDSRIFFSPDGRYLAFDVPPAPDTEARDVFVLGIDGSRQVHVVAHPSDDRVMGWSPDGQRLLFTSDRKGTPDLWAQPFAEGAPHGVATLVHSDIGHKSAIGMTKEGALYLRADVDDNDVMVASVDLQTGKTLEAPVRPAPRFLGSNVAPDWSMDGKYLAYASRRNTVVGGSVIVVQEADTGKVVRELRPKLGYPTSLRWSPDGTSILVSASDAKGRIGVMRVDARTGEAITITTPRDDFWRGFRPEWSPDGQRIYFSLPFDSGTSILERELASGTERVVLRDHAQNGIVLSPDGRSIGSISHDGQAILLYPIAGGEPREVVRAGTNRRFTNVLQWTPDGRALIARRVTTGDPEQIGFVVVQLSGGAETTLQLKLPGARLHPDGRRVAFYVRTNMREVWVLENFLSRPAQ